MAGTEDPKDGRIAAVGKTVWPFWKTAGRMNKFWMIVGLVGIVAIIWNPWKKEQSTSQQTVTATTKGDKSDAYAAGRDLTVGVPADTVLKMQREVLNLKEVELTEKIQAEFPNGCVLLGVQNGKVIYESRLKNVKFDADWDNATLHIERGVAFLQIPSPHIKSVSGSDITQHGTLFAQVPFEAGKSARVPGINIDGRTFWLEVLDNDRGIFIIGFK